MTFWSLKNKFHIPEQFDILPWIELHLYAVKTGTDFLFLFLHTLYSPLSFTDTYQHIKTTNFNMANEWTYKIYE